LVYVKDRDTKNSWPRRHEDTKNQEYKERKTLFVPSCLRGLLFFGPLSDEVEARFPEVAVQQLERVAAEPAVDHAGVHRSEIGFVVDVAVAVLERRVLWIHVEVRGRAVEP